MFFLFDCDNFFVSCERVFAPGLKKRPVVVLSNNDGCVVSRSYEAKALGIPMGAPYFKIERFFTARGGVALSSNYELYADMSARVMSVLRSCFPNLEVYSIDEAFARLPDSENLEQLAAAIRTRILRETGISVSAGIAPTKTLCKIAAHCAKQKTAGKTFTLKDPEQIRKHLQQLDVIDIWGVGRHLSPKLGYLGIFTAWELAQTPLRQIRRCFNLRLAQTVLELNGTPCLELETEETAQSLTTSRSFEYEIKDYELLRKILAEFADAVSIRLRRQNAVAGTLSVFLRTNRFAAGEQYNNAAFVLLQAPTAHTGKLISAAEQGLRQIYRPGVAYKSAGVILNEIQPLNRLQNTFFDNDKAAGKDRELMSAIDSLNHRFGKKTVRFAPQAGGICHYIRRNRRSRSYTTSWDELATVA